MRLNLTAFFRTPPPTPAQRDAALERAVYAASKAYEALQPKNCYASSWLEQAKVLTPPFSVDGLKFVALPLGGGLNRAKWGLPPILAMYGLASPTAAGALSRAGDKVSNGLAVAGLAAIWLSMVGSYVEESAPFIETTLAKIRQGAIDGIAKKERTKDTLQSENSPALVNKIEAQQELVSCVIGIGILLVAGAGMLASAEASLGAILIGVSVLCNELQTKAILDKIAAGNDGADRSKFTDLSSGDERIRVARAKEILTQAVELASPHASHKATIALFLSGIAVANAIGAGAAWPTQLFDWGHFKANVVPGMAIVGAAAYTMMKVPKLSVKNAVASVALGGEMIIKERQARLTTRDDAMDDRSRVTLPI